MAQTQPSPRPPADDLPHQGKLLDTTLTRIIRYATQMKDDLRKDQLDLAHARQLGSSVLVVMTEAAIISALADAGTAA